MPQLDKVHFFSQYFWLCVFYFGFYFLVTKHFLPRMARILQFRKSKLSHTQQEGADKELSLVKESGNTALENAFSLSHKFWSHNTQRMDEWYGDKLYSLNNNYLQECNKLYVKSVGNYSLSQNAALGGIELAHPGPCYTWFFTNKLKQPVEGKRASSYLVAANRGESASSHGECRPSTRKGRHSGSTPKPHESQTNLARADSSAKKVRQRKDNGTSASATREISKQQQKNKTK